MTRFEGTFQGRTKPDASGFIQLVLIAAAAAVAVMIVMEYAALIITGAVVVAIVRGWFIYRQVLVMQAMAAAGERMRAEQRSRATAALAEKRAHEIAVAEAQGRAQAAASHALVAPLVAAIAASARRPMPEFQPEPVRVVRGEVTR